MRIRFPIVAVLAVAVAVGAVATITVLQARAVAARNAELQLVNTTSEFNGIQTLPWQALPQLAGHAGVHARLKAAEREILRGLELDGLASGDGADLTAPAKANFAALESIQRAAAADRITKGNFAPLLARQNQTKEIAELALADTTARFAGSARGHRLLAIAGVVTTILLLLGAFLFFFRRSTREMLSKQAALVSLGDSQHERDRLLQRTVEVAEEERRLVAADLHDGPIQELTVVALMLDQFSLRLARNQLAGCDHMVAQIRESVTTQMTSLRHMMSDLRPPILDEGGIGAAVNDLAEHVLGKTSVTWDVRSVIGDARFAPELETVVYRVAQEALVNIRKHADATHANVALDHDADTLRLTVTDDGKGFDRADAAPCADGSHLGLVGMHERVDSVGGTWRVVTTLGVGTRCEATVPWRTQILERSLGVQQRIAV